MNASQKAKVTATVADFVNRGFMFTAYDITKTVRADSPGENIRHNEVNDEIKALYANGSMSNYERDSKDVGGPVSPFVYYHHNSDLNNYTPDWIQNDPSQATMLATTTSTGFVPPLPPSVAPSAPSAPSAPVNLTVSTPPLTSSQASLYTGGNGPLASSNAKRVHMPTGEDRLQIPIKMIQQISNQGTHLEVKKIIDFANNKKPIVELVVGTNGEYSINKDGRVRLSPQIVSYLDSKSGQFDIELQGGTIRVEAV